MAQYDGSIRIGTEITTKQAEKELKSLESSISKTADKIASLRSKMDSLKDVKIPTSEYKKLQNELEKNIQKYEEVSDAVKTFEKIGTDKSSLPFRQVRAEAQDLYIKIEDLRGKIFDLEESGKAFTLGSDTEKYSRMAEQMQRLNQQMESDTQRQSELKSALATEEERLAQIRESAVVWNQRIVEAVERRKELLQEIKDLEKAGVGVGYQQYDNAQQELARLNQEIKDYSNGTDAIKEKYRQLSSVAKTAFNSIGKALKKANSLIDSFGKRIKQAFLNFSKSADGANKNALTASKILKSILKYGFGIRSIYVLVNKIRTGIKEGFSNFTEYSSKFKSSIDSVKVSALTLKNAFAAAFAPLVEMAIPYIQRVLEWLTKLMDIVGQITAVISGQESYTRAIKQTTAAIEDQNKAQNKQLSGLDKLNNLTSSSGGGGAGGGAADMFEEAPIEDKWKDLAQKINKIGKDLFKPLKKAWNKEGEFVMKAWKYALDEIWKLLKDIGRDFLEVWNQDKTVAMLGDILHIVGDIGLIVGNLAKRFRAAWNENKVGLRIFENIRDILAAIIHNIRIAADLTVIWADNLDFYPLLSKIEEWTRSLVPVFDSLSGIILDFYTVVLLPLAKWTLERGLPDLLQVFIDFNKKVDWEALRKNLKEFWKHLEPFAETIGEGLIIFIGRLSDALANFVNSDMFAQFLTTVENWMDNVKPEDVANALEKLAIAIIAIKGAIIGFSAISAAIPVFKSLASVLGLFGPAGIAVGALALAAFLSKTIEDVDMGKVGQAVGNAVIKLVDFIGQALSQTNWYMLGQKVVDLIAGIDWIGLFTSLVEALASILGNVIGGAFALVQALSEGIANLIINAIDAAKEYFQGKIEEAGGNIVLGILKGIVDGFVGIGNWIVEHIFQPFITGFKNAFGIHSPSTVMMEMGTYIIQGLLDGITSLVDKVTETWESMKDTALEIWEKVKTGLSEKWESMKESATTKWNEIKENLNTTWDTMKTTAEMNFGAIRDYIAEKWADTESNTDSTWGRIKETVSSIASDVSGVISSKFSEILSSLGNFSSNAQNAWSNTWNGIKNTLSSILSSIKDAIGSAFDWISNKVGSIGSTISGAFSGGGGATTYSGVMSYSAMPQMAALSKMEFPGYATGQVIPTSMKKHLAWLGDNKHETEVVSPLSTIEEAVENAMERAGGMGVRKVTIEIPLVVDGRELTRVVQDYDLQAYNRRGMGLFEH